MNFNVFLSMLVPSDFLSSRIRSLAYEKGRGTFSELGEFLGAPKNSKRQWKSELVRKTIHRIGKSFEQLDGIARLLGVSVESLILTDEVQFRLRESGSAIDPAFSDKELAFLSSVKLMGKKDQKLVFDLVKRLSVEASLPRKEAPLIG